MVFVVIGAFLAGWLVSSLRPVDSRIPRSADAYVLRFALPILVFSKISQMALDSSLIAPVVIAWIVMAGAMVIIIAVSRVMKWGHQTLGALLLVGVLGNTSFLGLGMVEGLIGSRYLPAAIAYDQLGTFVALATYGSFVASRWGEGSFSLRAIVIRLMKFMPFIALLLAIPARTLNISEDVYSALDAVGRTVGPVAMGSLGLRFSLRVNRSVFGAAVFGLTTKMLLLPIGVILLALATNNASTIGWQSSIIESAMPPMVTAGVVAVGAGFDEDLVSFMVGIGTLCSFLSVPLIAMLLP